MGILLALVVGFIVMTLIGYFFHWAIHQPWMGRLYQAHKTHHTLYTDTDFSSDKYRDAKGDNTILSFIWLVIPIIVIITVLIATNIISLLLGVLILVEMSVIGYVYNALHDSFHLRKSWWQIIPGYKRLKHLHLLHHKLPQKNFGIFWFVWDKVFGSFNESKGEE